MQLQLNICHIYIYYLMYNYLYNTRFEFRWSVSFVSQYTYATTHEGLVFIALSKKSSINAQIHYIHSVYGCRGRLRPKFWPEVIKLFPCSTQLSMEFILLINVKMPTFISMTNTTSERLKAKNLLHLLLWAVEISCSGELSMEKVYNLGASSLAL